MMGLIGTTRPESTNAPMADFPPVVHIRYLSLRGCATSAVVPILHDGSETTTHNAWRTCTAAAITGRAGNIGEASKGQTSVVCPTVSEIADEMVNREAERGMDGEENL